MQITKAIFDQLAPGEIFWEVTTRIQAIYDPMNTKLLFVCIKGKSGLDWAMYSARAASQPEDVARYGDKVNDPKNIRSICPCDDEVFELYRP